MFENLMDEVFGPENFVVADHFFKKTTRQSERTVLDGDR